MNKSSTRSERRRQRRRQRLIDAARQVIANKGVANLTVSDVTEAADVAVGSFYTYFSDKNELIEAAVWEDLQRLGDPHLPELQGQSVLNRARIMLQQTYSFVEKHRELMSAVFGADSRPDHFHRGLSLVETRVAVGLHLQTELPPEAIPWLSSLLAGMLVGGIRYALAHPETTAEEMTERTMRLITPLQTLIQTPPPS
ncbi:MAG: helix-turn-helix transcriptional regulator [Chloroflexi bacterium]|nr:helix-turn-helix transcriptional regulator [Chloroflexota bacterium]